MDVGEPGYVGFLDGDFDFEGGEVGRGVDLRLALHAGLDMSSLRIIIF